MEIKIKWQGILSEEISTQQGIQQGAKLSTSVYKCYNIVILDSTAKSNPGCHLADIGVQAPTCSNDIALLSNTTAEAHGLIDIVNYHTKKTL